MAEREELTEDERERFAEGGALDSHQAKALRIIDAHAADRAALVARVAELERERDGARAYAVSCSTQAQELSGERDELRQRLEAAERREEQAKSALKEGTAAAYEAHLRAESECAGLRAEVEHLRGEHLHPCGAREALVAELRAEVERQRWAHAAANAEVERLRAARETSDGAMVLQLQLADARAERDAANALLGRIVKYGQPAAPCEPECSSPGGPNDCYDIDCPKCSPDVEHVEQAARTAAEQRVRLATVQGQTLSTCTLADLEVLKEMDSVPTRTLENVNPLSDWAGPAKAELARREGQ